MPFDFPSSPTLNQVISGPGGIQFKWDGVKWVAGPVAAPSPFVARAGDTMTGALVLPGNASTNLQAVPLQQLNASVAPALNDTGRNLLHNGLFNIQQRGIGSWTTNGAYTADRWVLALVADTVSVTLAPINDASRALIGEESARSALNTIFTGSATASAVSYIEQRIESVQRLAGKTVTVSFWANASPGTLYLGLNMYQLFGTGGSPSAFVKALATGIAVQLSTVWTRYTATIALPSVSGKTFGTDNNDFTILRLFYSAASALSPDAGNIGVQSGTINLWGIQLEIGSVATPLEKADPQVEVAKCLRYYETNLSVAMRSYQLVSEIFRTTVTFGVPKRTGPTITTVSDNSTNLSGITFVPSNRSLVVQGTPSATGATSLNLVVSASADL